MTEMKSLTLNDKKYDSFIDQTAREAIQDLNNVIEPDLVIGLNVANTKMYMDGSTTQGRWLKHMKSGDVSVVSGDIAATAEKIKQGIPVRVALKEIHIYDDNLWFRGLAEAAHVMVRYNGKYPADASESLSAIFFLSDIGYSVLNIDLYVTTGNVRYFEFKNITTTSAN